MRSRVLAGTGVALCVVLLLLAGSLFTVAQTEQVLVTQFGRPVRVIGRAGLHVRLPLIQSVIPFDRRLLDFDGAGEEVILGDQRRLIVDSFTRYRIADPLQVYQAVGPTEAGIRARLNSVVSSSLRRVLGGETLLDVLSAARGRIMGRILAQVRTEMRPFGVAVEDVRIRRADLPPENTEAILGRMQSERERVARQARAEGAEASARIRADAERDRTVLLAQARSSADRLRGEGEAAASATYATAYGADPGFYRTWRTLQLYRDSLGGKDRLVLSPGEGVLGLLGTAPVAPP